MSTRLLDRGNPTRFLWIAAFIWWGFIFPPTLWNLPKFRTAASGVISIRRAAKTPDRKKTKLLPDELQAQENLVAGASGSGNLQ
jgi:hypothetical protein